ncbi:MAG TPA: hypothetical protein VLH08_00145 [Acidobacteriota bacterium]|nr:hypothetical protein [Acidobacteriota bacterium]
MEIKKLQTSAIQQKAASESSNASVNRIPQTGVGRIKDGFDGSETLSEGLKLFADYEISSAKDSHDIFQIVDQQATQELGNQSSMKNKALSRYKRISSRYKELDE